VFQCVITSFQESLGEVKKEMGQLRLEFLKAFDFLKGRIFGDSLPLSGEYRGYGFQITHNIFKNSLFEKLVSQNPRGLSK
jgi:hypothetical protein